MKYKDLKALTSALLIGDSVLTKKDDEMIALLQYAYNRLANEADALKLFTLDKDTAPIIRNGPGDLYVRMPELPKQDEDELDIDEELTFAVARLIASFVSRERPQWHEAEANKIINSYNQKVQTFLEKLSADGKLNIYGKYDRYGKKPISEESDV